VFDASDSPISVELTIIKQYIKMCWIKNGHEELVGIGGWPPISTWITFFLKDHDQRRRVGARTRTDNTCGEQFLKKILHFIFLGKGMMIGTNNKRKATKDKGNGIIMNTMRRNNSLGSGKKNLIFGEDGLEVPQHRGCLSGMNGMELCNNDRMTFFEDIFYAMGTYDLRGTGGDALELILLALLVELHS
jgi:hypothetical protein